MAISFRLRESYDWAVIGESPGALLSAAMAAKMGFSTIIVPLANRASLFRSQSGQVVDPELAIISGAQIRLNPETSIPEAANGKNFQGLLGKCLQSLELTPAELARLEWLPFSFRLETPESRFFFGGTDRLLSAEVSREFGDDPFLKAFCEKVASSKRDGQSFWEGYLDHLSWKDNEFARKKGPKILGRALSGADAKIADELFPNQSEAKLKLLPSDQKFPTELKAMKEVLTAVVAATHAGAGLEDATPWMAHSLYSASVMFRAKGGLESLRQVLIDVAKRWGAHHLGQNECRRVFIESGKFVGFQASQISSMISARAGAVDIPLHKIESSLEISGKTKMPEKKQVEAAGWMFTLSMTVLKSHLPTGLGAKWIWSEDGAPVIHFEAVDPIEYGLTEADHRILFVRTVIPWENGCLDPQYLKRISALLYEKTMHWIPDLDRGLVRIYPDFRSGIEDLSKLYAFSELADIPDALIQRKGSGLGSQTGIEGLALISRESFPQLGQMGEWVAAAEAITGLSQKNGYMGYLGKPAPKEETPLDLENTHSRRS
ncbi:MAG: hypothetical protein JNL01_10310 [Bdellovibrionales bacterium]|nr:hypothetical protein [Bdellovibrionales bacterium]